ncbi:MAG: hypothetical protein CME31_15755 [Gimesia sp.]|uniref:Uncharacterized protein n=1 Tax=Gimesia maris TaxID=122 RepID=A0A3D3RCV3_9PLAN|nr:hypothetical protein [Gimesia sp.]HCO26675.1 hypothetical protein [Gimesia maris]
MDIYKCNLHTKWNTADEDFTYLKTVKHLQPQRNFPSYIQDQPKCSFYPDCFCNIYISRSIEQVLFEADAIPCENLHFA